MGGISKDAARLSRFPGPFETRPWLLRRRAQREVKRRTRIEPPLRPHATMVAMHDALHGCQADPRSLELALGVEALEGAEQPGRVGHVEAGPVVFHEINRRALANLAP